MKTKIISFVIGLLITNNLLSQNPGQEYADRMNYIFQYIDKNRITTGLLSDYGLQLVEPDVFNGIPGDSNYVSMDTWKMLYSGLFTSKINNTTTMALPDTVFSQIDNAVHAAAVPVAMMHYQYNKLMDSAAIWGWLNIVNDQIFDVPGMPSPYLQKNLFAVAPKNLEFNGGTVGFVFNANLWYQNVNKTILKWEINFNNESGYLSANWNTPVSYTFGYDGIKTIYFRLTYTDGTSYTSQTNILVTGNMLFASSPDIKSFSLPAVQGVHSGGTIQYQYSPSNTSGQFKKPLIVAEGFDVSGVVSGVGNTSIYNL